MPIIIPTGLPARETLNRENIFAMDNIRADAQDIRPLKILIVNLMPTKIATETQLARVLANTPLQVELTLVAMDSHNSKNTSQEHMTSFYKTLSEIKGNFFDGMIITGAPVETLAFEDVDYWDELCELFEFSKTNVYSSMHICWGAQAGLYYHYNINKRLLKKKVFGVFEHSVTSPFTPLMRGFDEVFYAPHSRHTEVREEDILKHSALKILAKSDLAGPHIISTENGKQIFVLGHQEYDKDTLASEYFRDVKKGLEIEVPCNYFKDNNPKNDILFRWRSHASLLFSNWLNYYVYQETPYDLTHLSSQ
ncbi:MAG: homoserine O-acetyltransferase MetA [Eubacteriales bacterium]